MSFTPINQTNAPNVGRAHYTSSMSPHYDGALIEIKKINGQFEKAHRIAAHIQQQLNHSRIVLDDINQQHILMERIAEQVPQNRRRCMCIKIIFQILQNWFLNLFKRRS